MHQRSLFRGLLGGAGLRGLGVSIVVAAPLFAGCGGGTTNSGDAGAADTGMVDSGIADTGVLLETGPAPDTGALDATVQDGGGTDAGCTATPLVAQQVALFAMIDQSGIMGSPTASGGTRWDGMAAGVNGFVTGAPAGVSFGLQYFGLPDPRDPTGSTVACTASSYATPDVMIGAASAVATAVSGSLSSHGPSSVRATSPAQQGAYDYAQGYLAAHPDEDVAVVLVVGGDPTQCDISTSRLASQAATARAAGVRSTVIALGPPLPWSDAVAAAGEFGAAIDVDDSSNVPGSVFMGLHTIAASRCTFTPPAGVDPTTLQLRLTTESGPQMLGYRTTAGGCGTSQGFLVDSTGPQPRVVLCPSSCATYRAATAPVVETVSGC